MFKKIIKFNLLLVMSLFLMTSSTYANSPMDSLNRSENLKLTGIISEVGKLVPNKDMSKTH